MSKIMHTCINKCGFFAVESDGFGRWSCPGGTSKGADNKQGKYDKQVRQVTKK